MKLPVNCFYLAVQVFPRAVYKCARLEHVNGSLSFSLSTKSSYKDLLYRLMPLHLMFRKTLNHRVLHLNLFQLFAKMYRLNLKVQWLFYIFKYLEI